MNLASRNITKVSIKINKLFEAVYFSVLAVTQDDFMPLSSQGSCET